MTKLERLMEHIDEFKTHMEWMQEHTEVDKQGDEYEWHKDVALLHREKICEILNEMGIETLPFREEV